MRLLLVAALLWLAPLAHAGILYDNTDDRLVCGDNAAWAIRNVFISAWVKLGDNGTATDIILGWSDTAVNNDKPYLWSIGSGGVLKFDRFAPSGGAALGTVAVDNSAWHHVAMWLDDPNNLVYFWVDGAQESITYTETFSGAEGNNLSVGAVHSSVAYTDFFPGTIDEVSLWNTATIPSAQDIALLASSRTRRMPLQVLPSALVLYLPMDDSADGTSADVDAFMDLSATRSTACAGDDGANNTGLTAQAGAVLSYP